MLYSTIVKRDESGFNSIYEAAQEFEEQNVLEAIVACKFDQKKINQTLNLVRMYQCRLNNESMDLAEFSENFIEQYATDNNKCFHLTDKLVRRIGTTITGSMKIFRRFCPVVRRKLDEQNNIVPALDYSRLRTRKFQGQFFGVEPYVESVKTLLHELTVFFYHLVSVMALCKEMIRKEDETRNDYEKLKKIFEDNCDELLSSAREAFKTFGKVQLVSEEELEERRKNARPMKEWLQIEYHNRDRAWMKSEGVRLRIDTGSHYGLDGEASLLWAKNPEKGQEVCKVIPVLDTLGLPYKHNKKATAQGKKGTFDARVMVFMLKWSGVSHVGDDGKTIINEDKERKFYQYCMKKYKGEYLFPTWQAVCRERRFLYEQDATMDSLAKNFESYLYKAA